MGGEVGGEQGFKLAGAALRRAWWMLGAEIKPLPLKEDKGTHALQTGSLVGPAAPSAGRDPALRRGGIVQPGHKQGRGWERYLRPCACEGNLAGGGLCWRKGLHDSARQLC